MLKTSIVDLFSSKPVGRFLQTNIVFLNVLLKDAFGFALSRDQTADTVKKRGKKNRSLSGQQYVVIRNEKKGFVS